MINVPVVFLHNLVSRSCCTITGILRSNFCLCLNPRKHPTDFRSSVPLSDQYLHKKYQDFEGDPEDEMKMSRSSTNSALMLLLLLELLPSCTGFSGLSSSTVSLQTSFVAKNRHRSSSTLFNSADPIAAEEAQVTIEDKNGKTISVGSIVRVVAANTKAFQVPAKGRGAFNENKEFVPAPADGERATKNLLLPVGMRGVVTKVYDTEAISSNFPVQVKFTPGANTDEGYDPPLPFLMHFGAREVECV